LLRVAELRLGVEVLRLGLLKELRLELLLRLGLLKELRLELLLRLGLLKELRLELLRLLPLKELRLLEPLKELRLLELGLDERLTDAELWPPPLRLPPPPPLWAIAGVKLSAKPTIASAINFVVFILILLSLLVFFLVCF
jgi:hypothetical protein